MTSARRGGMVRCRWGILPFSSGLNTVDLMDRENLVANLGVRIRALLSSVTASERLHFVRGER